jgi:hypothetical protein
MEIIQKIWTKEEILSNIGKVMNQKTALKAMGLDTTEVDSVLQEWKDRYDRLE